MKTYRQTIWPFAGLALLALAVAAFPARAANPKQDQSKAKPLTKETLFRLLQKGSYHPKWVKARGKDSEIKIQVKVGGQSHTAYLRLRDNGRFLDLSIRKILVASYIKSEFKYLVYIPETAWKKLPPGYKSRADSGLQIPSNTLDSHFKELYRTVFARPPNSDEIS